MTRARPWVTVPKKLMSGRDDLVRGIAVVSLVAIGRRAIGSVVASLPAVVGLVEGIRRRTVRLPRPAVGLGAGSWRIVRLLRSLRIIGRSRPTRGRAVSVVLGRRVGRRIGLLLGRRGHRPQDHRQKDKQASRQRDDRMLCEHGSTRGLVSSPFGDGGTLGSRNWRLCLKNSRKVLPKCGQIAAACGFAGRERSMCSQRRFSRGVPPQATNAGLRNPGLL